MPYIYEQSLCDNSKFKISQYFPQSCDSKHPQKFPYFLRMTKHGFASKLPHMLWIFAEYVFFFFFFCYRYCFTINNLPVEIKRRRVQFGPSCYKHLYLIESISQGFIKDCLPHLFHGFRNRHFNKISLNYMLYFHN